jgi:hypothetical protein
MERAGSSAPMRSSTTMEAGVKAAFESVLPPQFKRVAIPLTIKGSVVCLPTGIPKKTAGAVVHLPSNARSTDYKQVLKFPMGGLHLLMGVDSTFLGKLCTYVMEGQKPKLLQLTDRNCACCRKPADGFVCTTQYEPPDSESLRLVQPTGATMNMQRASPACKRKRVQSPIARIRGPVAKCKGRIDFDCLRMLEKGRRARQRCKQVFPFALAAN